MKDSRTEVHLPRSSSLQGEVRMLVGGYIGPMVYAADGILQRRAQLPTKALRDIFRNQLDSEKEDCVDSAVLAKITVGDVESELKVPMAKEQRDVCSELLRQRNYLAEPYLLSHLASLGGQSQRRQRLAFRTIRSRSYSEEPGPQQPSKAFRNSDW